MDRRRFLASSLGLAASAFAGIARADQATFERFHAALERDPRLALFTNVTGEQAGDATIEGRLPADLEGIFFRNGPGRFELGGERYHHWFDGDGFVQRWRIAGGKVSHRGRFVETQKFVDETRAGEFLYPAFGTWIARRGIRDNDTLNAANTNLLPFNGKLYALWEGGSAIEMDPETLATIGVKTWRDDLKAMPFSAHPKPDPDGGMWNFGTLPGRDKIALYRIGADGRVLQAGVVEVPKLAMVHDFAVSARHLVFIVPPYDLREGPDLSLAERHVWAGSGSAARPTRVIVVSKADLTVRKVFELPPQMVFHFANAYDDGGSTHVDVVQHNGDALAALGKLMIGERQPNLPGQSPIVRVTLDYASGQARTSQFLGSTEFPRVMPQVSSARHRYFAVLSSAAGKPFLGLDTVNMVDTRSGKVDSYRFGAGWQVEEHVLVPRRNARSETEGYLVGVAQDLRVGVTVLTVFDAARVSAGPVAQARLPYRTPHCFHGNFLMA